MKKEEEDMWGGGGGEERKIYKFPHKMNTKVGGRGKGERRGARSSVTWRRRRCLKGGMRAKGEKLFFALLAKGGRRGRGAAWLGGGGENIRGRSHPRRSGENTCMKKREETFSVSRNSQLFALCKVRRD